MFKFSFLLVLTLFSFAAIRAQDLAFPEPRELIDGEQQEPHDDRFQDLNMSPRQRDVLSESKTRRLSNGRDSKTRRLPMTGRKSRNLSGKRDDDDDDSDDDIFTSGKKRI